MRSRTSPTLSRSVLALFLAGTLAGCAVEGGGDAPGDRDEGLDTLALDPSAGDGSVSGTYTESEEALPVRFSATPDGEVGARARYEIGSPARDLSVRMEDRERGTIVWRGLELDGYGPLTGEEEAALRDLRASGLADALAMIPLELDCRRDDVAPAAMAALLMPWQMLLKYATPDIDEVVRDFADRSSCVYFPAATDLPADTTGLPTSAGLPSLYILSHEVPYPSVFGYFPFDGEGAMDAGEDTPDGEASRNPGSLPSGSGVPVVLYASREVGRSGASRPPARTALLDVSADGGAGRPGWAELLFDDVRRNEFGPGNAMCRGACGADCPWTCRKEVIPQCTLDAEGRPGVLEVVRSDCGTHEGCRTHDDHYDDCKERFPGGGWASFQCHRQADGAAIWYAAVTLSGGDLRDGAVTAGGWSRGLPPYDGRMVFEYTRDSPDAPENFTPCEDGQVCEDGACRDEGWSGEGASWGDPHLMAFDSTRYNFHAVGDYVLVRSTDPDDDLEIQVRYLPLPNGIISMNGAVAMRVAGDRVALHAPSGGRRQVHVDGEDIDISERIQLLLPGGGTVLASPRATEVTWPDGTNVTLSGYPADYIYTLKVRLADGRRGRVEGLLGDFDGDPANDIRIREGAVLVDPAPADIHGAFRESWRVPLDSPASLFDRGPDLWDPLYPGRHASVTDLDPDAVRRAEAACREQGVSDPAVLADCVFDVALTGEELWAGVAAENDPATVDMTVHPPLSYLLPGETKRFRAIVGGATNGAAEWSLSGGGALSSIGANVVTYTAPSTPGEATITAILAEDGAVSATATVVSMRPSHTVAMEIGRVVSGRLGAAGGRDAYSFSADGGDRVLVRMAGTSGDLTPTFQVYGPDDALLCDAATYAGFVETICDVDGGGTYTVLAGSHRDGGTGGYDLFVQRTHDPAGARPVEFGQTVSGRIGAAGAMEALTFTAAAGVQMLVRISRASGGSLAPMFQVYRPDGTLLCESGTYSFSADRLCTIDRAGRHTVLTGSHHGRGTGGYDLHLQRTGDPVRARAMGLGETVSSRVDPVGAMEAFTFVAPAAAEVLVRMSRAAGGSLNAMFQIYRPDGTLLCDASTYSFWVDRVCTIDMAGRHTVLTGSHHGDETGGYALHLRRTDDPSGATPIAFGETTSGRLDEVGAMEAFTFTAASGAGVLIRMSRAPGSTLNPMFQVYRPDGTLLCRAGTSGPSAEETCVLDAPGPHLLLAGSYHGLATGSYDLFIGTP